MSKSRRQFLTHSSLALLGVAAGVEGCRTKQKTGESPAGEPPAFGTAPAVGPEVSPSTFAEAEKLVQVELTSADREHGSSQLAREHGSALRAAYRAAQAGVGADTRTLVALERGAAR